MSSESLRESMVELESVLCDPEVRSIITRSDAGNALIDEALNTLRAALAQRADEPAKVPNKEVNDRLYGTSPSQRADEPVEWPEWAEAAAERYAGAYEHDPREAILVDVLNAFRAGAKRALATAAPAAPAYVPLSEDLVQETYLRTGGYFAFARAIEAIVVARMRGEG